MNIPIEDQRKIHAEINQIVNQRFLLTTLAVSIFGAFAAFAVPKQGGTPASDLGLAYTAAMLLFAVFGLLYFASHSLRGYLRVLTTYLAASKSSTWERHWETYRKGGHFAYTKTQALFFAVLGALVAAYPFMVEWQLNHNFTCRWEYVAVTVLFAIYELVILVAGFSSSTSAESKCRARWETILAAEEAAVQNAQPGVAGDATR